MISSPSSLVFATYFFTTCGHIPPSDPALPVGSFLPQTSALSSNSAHSGSPHSSPRTDHHSALHSVRFSTPSRSSWQTGGQKSFFFKSSIDFALASSRCTSSALGMFLDLRFFLLFSGIFLFTYKNAPLSYTVYLTHLFGACAPLRPPAIRHCFFALALV